MKRRRLTDGCSFSPELWYHHCCNRHDLDYLFRVDEDGKPLTRAAADARFFACMRKAGGNLPLRGLVIPALYWIAVRRAGWYFWRRDNRQQKNGKNQSRKA